MQRSPARRLALGTSLFFVSVLSSCVAEIGDVESFRGGGGGVSDVGRTVSTATTSTGSIGTGMGGSGGASSGGGPAGAGSGGDNGSSSTSSTSAGTTGSGTTGSSSAGGGAGAGSGGTNGNDASASGGSAGADAGSRGGAGGRAGAGGAAGGTSDAGSAPTFRQVSPVVSRNCARCHASWPQYATLTTHRVNQCGGNVLVKPNDAKNSAFLQVVQGQCGSLVMPKGCGQTPCIAAADIQLITQWIEAGAPNN
jgi:hypothetical protein